jgi:nitrous oxide reductase accessory protein NosL
MKLKACMGDVSLVKVLLLCIMVAFGRSSVSEEAEAYQREHGGRVLNYDEALQSVKEQ